MGHIETCSVVNAIYPPGWSLDIHALSLHVNLPQQQQR